MSRSRAQQATISSNGATHELLVDGGLVRDEVVIGKNYRIDVKKKDDGRLFRRFLFSLCNAELNRN